MSSFKVERLVRSQNARAPAKRLGPMLDFPRATNRVRDRGDIVTKVVDTVRNLVTRLISRPETALVILVAAAFTVSTVTTPTGQSDLYDVMVKNLKDTPATKQVGEFLEKYKLQSETVLWFLGVYLAVATNVKIYVLIIAALTVVVADITILQATAVAMGTYAFLSVKDNQVRGVAFAVAALATWYALLGE